MVAINIQATTSPHRWVTGNVGRDDVPEGRVVMDEVLLSHIFSLPIIAVKSIPHSCHMALLWPLMQRLVRWWRYYIESVEAWQILLYCMKKTDSGIDPVYPKRRVRMGSGSSKKVKPDPEPTGTAENGFTSTRTKPRTNPTRNRKNPVKLVKN
ncbi:hypothetical protein QVD17_39791 [Tagetes erecta]|uniref:Uncharacterized protein n=1 Tax=Tagetes erecta TaxID=13708 RepID=A0AAD8JR42_TARER|nr:hypothetical protein QVD17_39791 [Tagetes erecta]